MTQTRKDEEQGGERVELTKPQLELLRWVAETQYGEGTFRGQYLLTARALQRRGLLEPLGYGPRTYGITDAGRRVVAPARYRSQTEEGR